MNQALERLAKQRQLDDAERESFETEFAWQAQRLAALAGPSLSQT